MKQAENFKGLTKYEDKMQFGTQPKPIVKYFYMNSCLSMLLKFINGST